MDLTKPPEKIFVGSVVGVVALLWLLVWLFGPKPEPVQPAAQRPDPARRAVPRRAPRLAPGRPLAVRHPGARPVGAGDQRPAP